MGTLILFLLAIVVVTVLCPTVVALSLIGGISLFYVLGFIGVAVVATPSLAVVAFIIAMLLAVAVGFSMVGDLVRWACRRPKW